LSNRFDGTYYKHQSNGRTVAVIAGSAADCAFVQIITERASRCLRYPLADFSAGDTVRIGGSMFSKRGIKLDIDRDGVSIHGAIAYAGLTPLKYDVMGPLKYVPMQCRHRIVSLRHSLNGSLELDGEILDFTGGTGYIEGDSGTSFPRDYAWVQCGGFPENACIVASAADIPFAGLHPRGCIGVVYIGGVEYRIATYLGGHAVRCDERRLTLRQRGLLLDIAIEPGAGHALLAPQRGGMEREIHERAACSARFRFVRDGEVLFDRTSDGASVEIMQK